MGLQPGGASLTVAGWVARTGSILFSLIMIVTRKLRDSGGLTLITWQTLGVMLAGAVSAPFAWVTPGPVDFLLLGSLGLAATVAHMCVNRSLRLAPAAVVVPFQDTGKIGRAHV